MSAPSLALLSALSVELAAMMETVEALSGMAADHVRQNQGEARIRALVDAQAIDDLSQRLGELSGLAGAVSQGKDLGAAIGDVRLADLQSRLQSAVVAAPPATVPARSVAGDLMLFE